MSNPTPRFWAPVTNISSQRFHWFENGKALCGVPWMPTQSNRCPEHPGRHVSCRKCDKLFDAELKARKSDEQPGTKA